MASPTGAARPGPGRPSADAAIAKAEGEALAGRIREIGGEAAAPVDALEPALRAILEATGTAGGAVCLFDQRQELLRLAAEAGLSDEGCRRLRIVRRGDVAGWDMPLHGLLNRRAYLIESAAQNRYVPPLVESTTPIRAVACLPLYAGATPVGSLVLVALMPRTIGERDIRKLDQPLRELARLIEVVRRESAASAAAASEAR
ncbi:MAG TPA: GAF domain-containing protein, partial [Candidatus Binatia bacterium]|nr:GAF domain-containing protein [Candidatus Binatia bacterium]